MQRNIAELLDTYHGYLLSKVSKVRILGEAEERELNDVFVELSIVDQHAPQQHGEFLGMMDSAMRWRIDPLANASGGSNLRVAREALMQRRFNPLDGVSSSNMLWQYERETKRRVKPSELLRRRTKAIITGAPGCGKTTLLKYLALQAQEKEKRLAVWLELKAIDKPLFAQAEKIAARDGNLILHELWLKHLKTQLSLGDREIKLLREYWQEKFKRNEIAVMLDGFDELQDEAIERNLNKCVREFASALHDNALLISTRPYAQHKLGNERLQELEIEPLNQRQIEAFLDCYYPNDRATKSLLKSLRERSSLRELLHVPLLLGIVLRLHRENRFTDERLNLYETIITDLVQELDRSKSVIRQFKISDERLRLDFLKSLAFERLLRDQLDEEEQEVNRIVFSYGLLKEKAIAFLEQEHSSHTPRDLADDVLATPLLREVGADMFAFTHLTLQEYLAARAFASFYKSDEFEGLKIFCRAFHNPAIVEMEVLPMMLGATTSADKLYAEIARWPESLTFANLRLRARGLTYLAKIRQDHLLDLIDRLFEFISWKILDEAPYRDAVINSFVGVNHRIMSLIEIQAAAALIEPSTPHSLWEAEALGQIGSEKAVDALILALNDKDSYVRSTAALALGRINSEKAVDALISALNDEWDVCLSAANALRQIGAEKAVNALISTMHYNGMPICQIAAEALGRVGSEEAVEALISALKVEDWYVRSSAALALGQINSSRVIDNLVAALNDESSGVRDRAAHALGRIGSNDVVNALNFALSDKGSNVRSSAARALGRIGSDEVVEVLISTLKDEGSNVRSSAANALSEIGSIKAVGALISFLNHSAGCVRSSAAELSGMIGLEKVIYVLLSALNHSDSKVRSRAAELLREVDSEETVEHLSSALSHSDSNVRLRAAELLRVVGSEKTVDDLIFALNDEDLRVCWEVAQTLAQMKVEPLISGLAGAVKQQNIFVRKKAASVIGYYSNDKQTLDQLKQLAQKDKSINVRKAAKEAAEKLARKLELLNHFISEGTASTLSDNESRELFLVGEAFRVVAEAGHIFRPTPNSDWGIDGEIEFKNDRGEASGRRVYLQLKSGDSYLHKRIKDGKEIFTVKPRHAEYWQSHAYPVLLVIRDSGGRIRWMNVTEYLQQHGTNTKQIEFQGESFTAESVRQMRARFAR
jgi:HEAT repeat protein/energy-coupling factor transporter ATP-binding protein EcfA2